MLIRHATYTRQSKDWWLTHPVLQWNPWIDLGGDLDQETRQGDTALMLATAAGNTEAVKLLLHHGVIWLLFGPV